MPSMTQEHVEKLKEYIRDLDSLTRSHVIQIGAIFIDEKDRLSVIKDLGGKKRVLIHVNNRHEDLVLKDLISALRAGKTAVLNIQNLLPAKIYNQLHNIASNHVYVMLAGEKKPQAIHSIPQSAKVVLLMTKKFYDDNVWGDLITSACRL